MLNQMLVVNGQAMTIVGVARRGFYGTTVGSRPDVFVPITMRRLMWPGSEAFEDRRGYWAYLFARLKPGVTLEQARTALNAQYHTILNEVEAPLQKGMSEQTMARFKATPVVLEGGRRGQSILFAADVRIWLEMLLGITGFVLIIACANVANLLLARGAAREAEISLRLSMGASRGQIVRQLMAESCLLALLAGGAGILAGQWTLDLISSFFPVQDLTNFDFSLDGRALLFAALLALGTALGFGLYPAAHASRSNLMLPLKSQAGQPTATKSRTRFRTGLVVTQIALSLTLLVVAGLFARSLLNVSHEKLGMNADHVITFGISPERNGYSHQRSLQLFERLEDWLTALPGVTSVTNSWVSVLNQDLEEAGVAVEGFKAGPDTDTNSMLNKIGSGYFQTLGIPLISGREFTRSDNAESGKVAIVNEAFAKKFNLGRDAVGKHISLTPRSGQRIDMEIVGLAQNSKYSEVREAVPPLFFIPYRQDDQVGALWFYVRTSTKPDQSLPAVTRLVARLDPNLPVQNLRTMKEQVRESIFMDRAISWLSMAFAGLATLLAAVGLYGVIAYAVAQRTRDIGLRIALGASRKQVSVMVFRQVGTITLVGTTVGLGLALAAGRLAQSLLFQLQGTDPAVFCGSAVVLACVATISGYVPARRASHLDPMQALRCE
jgi:predicted permease